MSASARCRVASQGATYKTAIMANTTKLSTEASAAADIVLMAFSPTALCLRRSAFPKPGKRVLSFRKPGGRKDRGAFEDLLAPRLHGVRETGRYVKGKFLRARRAVARDDAIVSPLHHARTELMAELRRIDQQERRPHPPRFPCKQGKRCFERPIGHCGRQPPQLQDPIRLVMDDFPPGIAGQCGAHCAPSSHIRLTTACLRAGALCRKLFLTSIKINSRLDRQLSVLVKIQALSNETRFKIVDLVRDREMAAGTIAKRFKLTRPAVPQHIAILREAGLLVEPRVGAQRDYVVKSEAFDELVAYIQGF